MTLENLIQNSVFHSLFFADFIFIKPNCLQLSTLQMHAVI